MTPLHKKGRKDARQNYRPVSILPTHQKFTKEACLNKCLPFLTIYFINNSVVLEKVLVRKMSLVRKGFSTQVCLLTLLEKWKNAVHKGKMFGALPTIFLRHATALTMNLLLRS